MKSFNRKYVEIKLYYFCVILLIANSVNSGLKVGGYDLIKSISNWLKTVINIDVANIFYLAGAFGAIYLATLPDFWLPFLGDSVLPHEFIPLKNNLKYDTTIKVNVPKNAKVAYWATNPSKDTPFVEDAYGDYNNSGVIMADDNGVAELKVLKGSGYIVPSGRYIQPHVHYRVLNNGYGMMGSVMTKLYD